MARVRGSLRRRGDLTVWLSEDAIDSWREPPSGKPGGQRSYANIAIEAALTIRMNFHLPLRQTEDFLRSQAGLLADGAYDAAGVYEVAQSKGEGRTVRMLILPGRDAQLTPRPSAALEERNRNIHSVRELGRRE